jgi:hypothetical protein
VERVPELEYIELESRPGDLLESQTPIILCSQCGESYAEDETRDSQGRKRSEESLSADPPSPPKCWGCVLDGLSEDYRADMLAMLEEKLGLAEKHRDALKLFIETTFTDPEKILKLERINNRVESLEREVSTWKWVSGITAGIAISALILAVTALAAAS